MGGTARGLRRAVLGILLLLLGPGLVAQRDPDLDFDTTVQHPAYTSAHPTVAVDEAHSNFHTAEGRYKPLAQLLRSDGYRVVRGTKKFGKAGLAGVDVLVISNATAPGSTDEASGPAFTEAECDAVRDWVRGGGALLLIADHTPYGAAAANLARRFGVDMGQGFVFDFAHSEPDSPASMLFSRDNGLLGSHPLLRGRNAGDEVRRVVAFSGQSLGVPPGATALLKLASTARESASAKEVEAALSMDAQGKFSEKKEAVATHSRPAGGRAQAVALAFGKGRVVVAAEAAMFSAQTIRYEENGRQQEFKMGMNVPGNDDRQFVLNVFHWLSGLLG